MATVSKASALDKKPSIIPMKDIDSKNNEDVVLEVDPAVHKSLLRKLDYRMMPVFFIMYFLNHCQTINTLHQNFLGAD